MYIAQSKRRSNIAEYILYLWQLEDLLRALKFSPESIFNTLVAPQEPEDVGRQNNLLTWYMQIGELLREEGKAESGHLDHTLHLIADLDDMHRQLLVVDVGERYRGLFARLQPELPRLRATLNDNSISDTELQFRALYAAMLYRMKDTDAKSAAADDVVELVSPCISELARVYGLVERGELDIWKNNDEE